MVRVGLSIALCLVVASGCKTTAAEAAARGTWYEVKSARFVAWTDGDPEQARLLLVDLERFEQVMRRKTNAEERVGAPPLRIFLAHDRDSFAALTGASRQTGGLFIATGRGNFALVDGHAMRAVEQQGGGQAPVLFHELTHYVMAMQGARVPNWYNEGFAEYMATTEFGADGSYTIGCPPVYRTRWAEQSYWLPMAKVMEAENLAELIKNPSTTDTYAQAWYAVHYFTADPTRKAQLSAYLAAWADGKTDEAATKATLGMDYAQLDQVLRAYSKQPAFDCVRITPETPLAIPEVDVRPISNAEAHYHVGDLLLAVTGPSPQALENLERSAELAKSDAHTVVALARAHLELASTATEPATKQAELTKAEQHLAQIEQTASEDSERLSVLGHVLTMRAQDARAADEAAGGDLLRKARNAYRKAVRLDDARAEAYFGLGQTYLIADDGNEEGQVVLEAAAYLLPLDTRIALSLGSLQLSRGNPLQAIGPLEYVLRWSKDESQRRAAHESLQTIKSQSQAAAE